MFFIRSSRWFGETLKVDFVVAFYSRQSSELSLARIKLSKATTGTRGYFRVGVPNFSQVSGARIKLVPNHAGVFGIVLGPF